MFQSHLEITAEKKCLWCWILIAITILSVDWPWTFYSLPFWRRQVLSHWLWRDESCWNKDFSRYTNSQLQEVDRLSFAFVFNVYIINSIWPSYICVNHQFHLIYFPSPKQALNIAFTYQHHMPVTCSHHAESTSHHLLNSLQAHSSENIKKKLYIISCSIFIILD